MKVSFGDKAAGALNSRFPTLGPKLARLETRVLSDDLKNISICEPIYVTGFARAGSTLLLELLNSHPLTTSHRYADYRMLWTPYWWNTIRSRAVRSSSSSRERAHGDRIRVTFESPEAFEEVLWMHYFPQLHQQAEFEQLGAADANPAFERMLRDHIAKLLLVRGSTRYLAKANYHITRIALIAKMFPDVKFVVPVREPVAHIASLARQDRIFSDAGRDDPAVRRHLQRIGHFEFGIDKRPVVLPDGSARETALDWAGGRVALGYARQWASVYGYLLDTLKEVSGLQRNVHVVRYEALCAEPAHELQQVFAHCNLLDDDAGAIIRDRAASITLPDYYETDFEPSLLNELRKITAPTAARLGYASV